VSSDGNSFTLTTSDDKDVRVVLQEPVSSRIYRATMGSMSNFYLFFLILNAMIWLKYC
jgi:hypothetical protein